MTLSVAEQRKATERRERKRLKTRQWQLRTGYNKVHGKKEGKPASVPASHPLLHVRFDRG